MKKEYENDFQFADEADFNLKVFILNDNMYDLKNVTVNVQQLGWGNGLDPILTNEFNVDVVSAASSQIVETGLVYNS